MRFSVCVPSAESHSLIIQTIVKIVTMQKLVERRVEVYLDSVLEKQNTKFIFYIFSWTHQL